MVRQDPLISNALPNYLSFHYFFVECGLYHIKSHFFRYALDKRGQIALTQYLSSYYLYDQT